MGYLNISHLYRPPRPVTGIALLYGDGVCFLLGTNWTVSTATSSQYLAVNIQWVLVAVFLSVKRPEHEADHSAPITSEVNNTCNCKSALSYTVMAWCLISYAQRHICLLWNSEIEGSLILKFTLNHFNPLYYSLTACFHKLRSVSGWFCRAGFVTGRGGI
jgi:hypothetical protein